MSRKIIYCDDVFIQALNEEPRTSQTWAENNPWNVQGLVENEKGKGEEQVIFKYKVMIHILYND